MIEFKLRCVVIEDEDEIRNWMVSKLSQFDEIEIVGEATTLNEAYRLVAQTKPDVAFMDIQLIGGDAFTLLSKLEKQGFPIPFIVMATGYPEYVLTALNEYRRYVVQYLLKPFVEDWRSKFQKAIDALVAAQIKEQSINPSIFEKENPPIIEKQEESKFSFLQNKGQLIKLEFEHISYLEAAGSGESIVVSDNGNQQFDLTLNKFLEVLPSNFIRISRSNVINLKRVVSLSKADHTIEIKCHLKNKTLGLSDTYYQSLLKSLPMLKDQIKKM